MSLRLCDYDYPLPEALIARHPPARRQDARMMVIDRPAGTIDHRQFVDFPQFLRPGDLAVLNDTRVIPARLFSDDGRVELLFLERREGGAWQCMVKPGRRMRVGHGVTAGGVRGEVREVCEDGTRVIAFEGEVDLEKHGSLALPPYMRRQSEPADRERYQTIYAARPGAVAAPTAGLHFTSGILERVPHVFVTLHVGAGTFRPVQSERITDHRMHSERFEIGEPAAAEIRRAEAIVAIGTTTVRVLESVAREGRAALCAGEGATDIFIHPPYRFQAVDRLLTNFHLPKSTLLMLVSAFAGRELVLRAYREAVAEQYRFFSYGDCMLIL